jgi:hypothetical protein
MNEPERRRTDVWRTVSVATLLVAACLLGGVAFGQSARAPATIDDLHAEVRALRAEIHELAAAATRTQLLVTRVVLQEQRLMALRDQVAELQRLRRAGEADHRARAAHLKQLEDSLLNGAMPFTQQEEMDRMLARLRDEVARSAQDEAAFQAREQDLRDALSAEEHVWIDVSHRLDQIERALPMAP